MNFAKIAAPLNKHLNNTDKNVLLSDDALESCDPEIEILEFHEMMEAMETVKEEKIPEPLEMNSFEFFVQALSYFEGESNGKLSSSEQSPANPGWKFELKTRNQRDQNRDIARNQ